MSEKNYEMSRFLNLYAFDESIAFKLILTIWDTGKLSYLNFIYDVFSFDKKSIKNR